MSNSKSLAQKYKLKMTHIMTNKKEILESLIIEYFANMIDSEKVAEKIELKDKESEIAEILKSAQQDWNNAECDSEGETKEQKAEMDKIIELAAINILNLK